MPLARAEADAHTPSVLRSWLGTAAVPGPATNPTSTTLTTVGGAAWVAIGILVVAVAALSIVVGSAPSNEAAYLQSLAHHATVATLAFSLFAAADLLLVPALVALYPALAPASRAAALIGSGILALWAVQDLVVTETTSLALVSLARDLAGAGADARQGVLLAARYPLAVLPIATFLSYVVSSAGLLLIGAVMLRSPFPRGIGLLGVIAAVEGLVGGFYVVAPALSRLLLPSLVTFGLWALLSGASLMRRRIPGPVRRTTTAPTA